MVAWALRLAKGAGQAQSPRRVHPKHPEIVKRVDRGGGESVRKLAGGGAFLVFLFLFFLSLNKFLRTTY